MFVYISLNCDHCKFLFYIPVKWVQRKKNVSKNTKKLNKGFHTELLLLFHLKKVELGYSVYFNFEC